MAVKKVDYVEPVDYFPKELRKKYKVGEFAEPKPAMKPEPKKTPEKKANTKKK